MAWRPMIADDQAWDSRDPCAKATFQHKGDDLKMNRTSKLTAIAATGAIGLIAAFGGSAVAGKKGSVKYNDEKSNGSFYDPGIYAACDIEKLSAKEKRNKITVNASYRGSDDPRGDRSPIGYFFVNTKGGNKSDPEYELSFYSYDDVRIVKRRPVRNPEPGYPDYELIDTGKTAKFNHKDKKDVVSKIPVSAFGKTNKVGFQIQTCGEGAVDIAPGGDYFDQDFKTIKRNYLNVKV